MIEPLEPLVTESPESSEAPDPWGGRSPNGIVPFLVYDATGRILRTGYCSLQDLAYQAGPGEIVLEGQANDRLQKVVNGRVTDKTAEEIVAAQRPAIPPEKERAFISQEDWTVLQTRLDALNERLRRIEQKQP